MSIRDNIETGLAKKAREIVDESCFKIFKGKQSNNYLNVTVKRTARFIRLQLQSVASINLEKITIIKNQEPIASEFNVLVSSVYDERFNPNNLVGPESEGQITFHSKSESNPWILICLSQEEYIDDIKIYNRNDDYYWRALSIKIDVSNNLIDWYSVYDNLDYRNSERYQFLGLRERAVVDCYAMQVDPILKIIEHLSKHNIDEALSLHATANKLLNLRGRSLGPHGITRTFQDKNISEINLAYSELSRLLDLINVGFNLRSFISSGTLLGAIRDGGFIGHDDDIDICYISNFNTKSEILNERNSLCAFLKNNGYNVSKSHDIAHIWIMSSAGVAFDIFTGWVESDNCIMNPLDINGISIMEVFPLKKWSGSHLDIYIPNNPEELLKLNYGSNWRTPDPLWKFDWSKVARDYQFLYGDLK